MGKLLSNLRSAHSPHRKDQDASICGDAACKGLSFRDHNHETKLWPRTSKQSQEASKENNTQRANISNSLSSISRPEKRIDQ